MSLQTLQIELPSDILLTINESEQQLMDRVKLLLATTLYLEEKVTIGKAAQIAGLSRLRFETVLPAMQLPISLLEIEDVLGDAEKLG